jgi:hypothetical protein
MQSKHTLGIYIASMHTAVTRFFNLAGLLSNLYILIFFLKIVFYTFYIKRDEELVHDRDPRATLHTRLT